MENRRLLYLVQHTNKRMFKIGIGTNNRFNDLNRDYSIDWDSSIYFEGENDDITKIERILHKLFYEYRLEKQNGTGGTEWFSSDCLNSVVDSIMFNVQNSGFDIKLKPHEILLNEKNDNKTSLIETKTETESISWYERKQQIFNKYPASIITKWNELDNLEPTNKIIDEMNMLIPEFHCFLKSSELTQSVFFKNDEHYSLIPSQHDAMNYLCYCAREQIHKKYNIVNKLKSFETETELFEFLEKQEFKINLNDLSIFIDKYNHKQNKKKLSNNLKELKETTVKVGIFKQDAVLKELLEERVLSLLRRYTRVGNSNTIKYKLEPEILFGWAYNSKPFAKMYLTIQTKLTKTYTKILYEICKDYENLKSITKELSVWHAVLGFNNSLKTIHQVSMFKHNYLNKSVEEINEKTDIKILDIIGEKQKGVTHMTIIFEKQPESRLQQLGLIEEPITSLPFYNKSKAKLDNLVKNGYKVIDEDMWIQTDIKKNEEKYDAEVRIDKWLKETDQETQNDIYKILAESLDDCDDPMVVINDYKLIGIFTKETFTKNPKETIELLNEIIAALHENENTK